MHTPGPWTVHKLHAARGCYYIDQVIDRHSNAQSSDEKWELFEQESDANARLIAAAPELLEALKEITSAYERALKRFGAHEWGMLTVEHANAAIAKATQS